jgi:SHS2 domain-containing protein
MMTKSEMGFREVPHTADWEIKVWAPTLAELFIQSAVGMIAMMKIIPEDGLNISRKIRLDGDDKEILLVGFLSEILSIIDLEKEAPVDFFLDLDERGLRADLELKKIKNFGKEIKAVTYHHLKIDHHDNLWRTHIVFDV